MADIPPVQPTATSWPCPLCGRAYPHARPLITHLNEMHGVTYDGSREFRQLVWADEEGYRHAGQPVPPRPGGSDD